MTQVLGRVQAGGRQAVRDDQFLISNSTHMLSILLAVQRR